VPPVYQTGADTYMVRVGYISLLLVLLKISVQQGKKTRILKIMESGIKSLLYFLETVCTEELNLSIFCVLSNKMRIIKSLYLRGL
jgi:hypothetical protein